MNLNYIKLQDWKVQKGNHGKKVIAYIIVLLLILCVWPLGLITKPVESKSLACNYYETGSIQNDILIKQEFVPRYSYLESIALQLSIKGVVQGEEKVRIRITLYDDLGTLLHSAETALSESADRQYQVFEIGQEVEVGQTYAYELEGLNCESGGPRIRYGEKDKLGLPENKKFFYHGEYLPEASAVALYTYRVPLELADILVYDTWIVTMALLCYTIMKLLWNKRVLFFR